ncbi:MAG: hypothetical protein CSA33_05515 [Desulfobulbus propionicus]|nr:MAG: hypothetical protein CSA33_05515 [Desulfobulbus propionicus]
MMTPTYAIILCTMCGNEFAAGTEVCPYCGADAAGSELIKKARSFVQRTINLEKGMPQVRQALERLRSELDSCRRQRVRVVTLIHGYGSSGKGGQIRKEVRRYLEYLLHQGEISAFVPGEQFHGHGGRGKQLLHRFPLLTQHRDYKKNNPGITLVVI